MGEPPPSDGRRYEADRRSFVGRPLLVAIAMTPLLLLGPGREIVSTEATLLAAGVGVTVGASASVALEEVDLSHVDDIAATIGSVLGIVVATVGLWLLVPTDYAPTLPQFAVAFLWGFALADVARRRLEPERKSPEFGA
ncbi:hypothetical protein [Natronococcus occultus]|uniref:Uncharacterized protein n=1 Tax=Natronococcus occultus SP4 TaxID=694430 RepID=L0JYN9_9EURY|nr:hypothetical protein [Natronococcus occultus]AGB38167.1 hypothetical protein Natoc_2391 [Natronococcus occultus SP4]